MTASFLDSLEFPASKQDVIAAAVDQDVPQETLEALQGLRQERFDSPAAVETALSQRG